MRLTLRRLALAVLLTGCISIFFYTSPPTHSLPHPSLNSLGALLHSANASSSATAAPVPRNATSVAELWAGWAAVFHDARPPTPPVVLISKAANMPVRTSGPTTRQSVRSHARLSDDAVKKLAGAHARLVAVLDAADLRGDAARLFKGTGVVMVAGGEYFGPALVGIHMLRSAGSELPVEVFLAGADEYEKNVCEFILPALDARCILMSDFLGGQKVEAEHFQLKALALLLSSFQHVLLLDSDSIPLVAPEDDLLVQEPYLSKGLVVWPDFWLASEDPAFYRIAGAKLANGHKIPAGLPAASSEAGQLLVNKGTHLKALLLAAYYNVYGPEHYYPLLSQGALGQGDKETFMAAAVVLDMPYYRVKKPVMAVERMDGNVRKGSAMVQFHPVDDARRQARKNEDSMESGDEKQEKEIRIRPAFLHAVRPPPSLLSPPFFPFSLCHYLPWCVCVCVCCYEWLDTDCDVVEHTKDEQRAPSGRRRPHSQG